MDKSDFKSRHYPRKPTIKVHNPPRNANGNNFKIQEEAAAARCGSPDIHTSFQTFVNLWVKFNGAGTLFLQELCTLLSTSVPCPFMPSSSLAAVSLESHAALLQTVQEMDSLLLKYCNNRGSSSKNLISCILLYVKLQCQYHAACQDALNSYIQQLAQKCQEFNCTHISEQLVKLGLISAPCYLPTSAPPISRGINDLATPGAISKPHKSDRFSAPKRKPGVVFAPPTSSPECDPTMEAETVTSPRSNKNFRDSLFSLFNRKLPQSDVNKSLFYVQAPDEPIEGATRNSSLPMHATNHNLPPQLANNKENSASEDMVSEADLDNVINLLSGLGADTEGCLQTPTPATEPQFILPDNYFSVPQMTVSEPSQQPYTADNRVHSTISNPSPTISYQFFSQAGNPWSLPNILPGLPDYLPPHLHTDLPCTMPAIMQTVPSGFDPTPPTTSSVRMNQTWPLTAGGLTVNSAWSVGHESDDFSDDSSTGEPYHYINRDHLTHQHNDTSVYRPHDGFREADSEDEIDEGRYELPHNQRPRSMENLADATKLWPTSQNQLSVTEGEGPLNQHRPLQMYYSDPMSASNIWTHPDSHPKQPERDKASS